MTYVLIAILVVLVLGLGWIGFCLAAIASQQQQAMDEIIRLQARVDTNLRDAKLDQVSPRLIAFFEMVDQGYFPNLRRDDWYAKKADVARWEDRDNRMMYLDD